MHHLFPIADFSLFFFVLLQNYRSEDFLFACMNMTKKRLRVDGLKHAQPENNAFEKGPTRLNSTRIWTLGAQLNPTQPVFSSQKRVQPEKSGRVWPH